MSGLRNRTFVAHLVDRDHAVFCVGHRFFPCSSSTFYRVTAELVPAIHVLRHCSWGHCGGKDVDARDKRGHDGYGNSSSGEQSMTAVAARNIKFLSHSDQGGRGDGVQVMVNKRLRLYRPRLFQRHHRHRRARCEKSEDGQFPAPARRTRARIICRPTVICIAGGQRPERVDHAGEPGGLFRRHLRRRAPGPEIHQRACASTTWRNRKRRAKSRFCRSAGSARTASGMSASATLMSRCTCRNFPTICWSSST